MTEIPGSIQFNGLIQNNDINKYNAFHANGEKNDLRIYV